jgi:AcrR family transcriptional regulator
MYGTICVVSTAYELNGRINQKRRTRDALVAAARSIVAEGRTPTVEEVAEGASISRTTAYRYFPSQRALLAAAHPETAVESLLPEDAPEDVAARLDIVVAAYTRMILETESQQRTMLRLSLEADPEERSRLPLRQGRVIKWVEEALAPLQPKLPHSEVHRLALAIRSATGIEALAWLTDVAGLSREDAVALMCWSAQAMLDATILDRSGTGRKRTRGRRGAAPSP